MPYDTVFNLSKNVNVSSTFKLKISFLLLFLIGSYPKIINYTTNISKMLENEMWYKSQFDYNFHSDNQVFFKHGNLKGYEVNLAPIRVQKYQYLLLTMNNCYHNQIQDYLYFHTTDSINLF